MISCFINEESISPIVENVYYYGKINDKNKNNRYKFKLDNVNGYIYIQFSSNSEMVNLNILNDTKYIISPFDEYDKDGKKNIILNKNNYMNYIYLDFFLKNNQKVNQKLNNYVFKIINNYDINNKEKYKIKENNKIICKITKSKNGKKKWIWI